MEAASKRYFNIPELADALGQRLDKGTISSLVATSRHLKTLFEPWLYHELTLSYLDNSGRLLKSADSLRALARNVQHVRWLMCDQEEIGFLFNCLLAGQEAAAAETTDDLAATVDGADIGALSLSATPRPRWVPALETSPPSGTVIIPLPPMHCLTYLEVNLMPLGSIHWPTYRFPKSASSARKTLRQTCWIIQQCPNLLALELVHVPVQDSKDMRLLSTTIQGILGLQSLHLFVRAEGSVWREGFPGLFFGLGGCMKACKLFSSEAMDQSFYQDLADDWQGIEEDEKNEEKLDIPEIRRREEPLVNLTKFVAWGMDGSTTTDILTVFDHCPNVRILKVPSVSFEQKELTSLATSITTRCPHIRTLSLLDNEDGKLLLRLMEVMPANTLQKVKLNNFEYLLYPMTSRQIFANHARSLKIVDLRYTMYLSSQDMLTILEVCVALEEFKKHPNLDSGDDFMTLQDAVSVPWASKRIRHLELTIGIPDDFGHSPYYARLTRIPLVLSYNEQRQFTQLEKLYTQLGRLTDLEYLDLRAVEFFQRSDQAETGSLAPFYNHSSDNGTQNNTFPAMLCLPNAEAGKPGYLDLLRGWTKLKELRGSVCMETKESMATVGEKEVDWFLEHWPMLERVEFFSRATAVSEEFKRLDEARPDLILFR
ncbi:hypothetical protein BKA57DRAFT_469185 [Linnemannia elongata]|nr:hypothetical protein BKA57DRAFT_469185 [Linnemannia elongata]